MSYCKSIKRYEGTKSDKLREMINDKLKLALNKSLAEKRKDKELIEAYKNYKKAKDEVSRLRSILEKRKDELSITWAYDYDAKNDKDKYNYVVANKCYIPCTTLAELQEAQSLWTLNKKKEANKIWDSIIEKYELFN